MTPKLPKWLTTIIPGKVVVDPNIAYPAVFKALGIADKDIDQYWVEVAFQCAKMATQDAILGSEHDTGRALMILINGDGDRKSRWALKNFKPGRGVAAATKGREARIHYQHIKRALLAA